MKTKTVENHILQVVSFLETRTQIY